MAWPRRSRRASSPRHTPRESVVRPMSRAAPYPTLGVTAARWRSCRRPPPAIPHPPPHPPAPGVPQCRARPPYTRVLLVPLAARARSAAPCRCYRPLAAPRAPRSTGRRTRRGRHRPLPSRRTPWPLRATEITDQRHALKVRTPGWRRDVVDVVPQRQRGCGSFTQAATGGGARAVALRCRPEGVPPEHPPRPRRHRGGGRGARRRAPAGPPLRNSVARPTRDTPRLRGLPTCGEADRRRGGATHGPRACGGPGGRPGRRIWASSAVLPTDCRSGAACGPRSGRVFPLAPF